jgi:hypothetical protein
MGKQHGFMDYVFPAYVCCIHAWFYVEIVDREWGDT